MKKINVPCVVTIAGSDSSGGAGIQADIKTISATGCYAASVITALTAQNTQGVQAVEAVSPAFISQQIESVFSDLNVAAVKIGMLHNEEVIAVVAAALEKFKPKHVVLDPVMVAKHGCELLDLTTIDFLKRTLFSRVTLITPNLFEAEKILAEKISTPREMEKGAVKLGADFQVDVLIKGGHLPGDKVSDVLYSHQQKTTHWFHGERIRTLNTHGTGCTLSSAIASYLAQDYSLIDAISMAKQYLAEAIQSGSYLHIGQGYGPVDHFHYLRENGKK